MNYISGIISLCNEQQHLINWVILSLTEIRDTGSNCITCELKKPTPSDPLTDPLCHPLNCL